MPLLLHRQPEPPALIGLPACKPPVCEHLHEQSQPSKRQQKERQGPCIGCRVAGQRQRARRMERRRRSTSGGGQPCLAPVSHPHHAHGPVSKPRAQPTPARLRFAFLPPTLASEVRKGLVTGCQRLKAGVCARGGWGSAAARRSAASALADQRSSPSPQAIWPSLLSLSMEESGYAPLIHLFLDQLRSGDGGVAQQTYAATQLYHLMQQRGPPCEATAAAMATAGVIPALVQILSSSRHGELLRRAAGIVSHLALSSPERAEAIRGACGIAPLVLLMRSERADLQAAGADALAYTCGCDPGATG